MCRRLRLLVAHAALAGDFDASAATIPHSKTSIDGSSWTQAGRQPPLRR
jgi:hypothetical protein